MALRPGILAAAAVLAAGCQLGGIRSSAPEHLRQDPSWVLVPEVKLIPQESSDDCGVAALATVINYWQPDTAAGDVARSLGPIVEGGGIEAGRLRSVAKARGLNAFLIEGTVDDLAYALVRFRPVIVGVVADEGGRTYGHYDVVVGMNLRRRLFLVGNPGGTWRQVPFDDLFSRWRRAHQLALMIFP
jgi:ABC-type bacteriocin/lantibiotic exporter with double-glycine peptidase domain